VVEEIFSLFGKANFYVNLGNTLLRCLIGFITAFTLGFAFGILGGKYKWFHACVRPFTAFLKTTPVMALTLLIMVWFKTQNTPVAIGFIMVFPIVYQTVADSVATVDKKLLEVAEVYGFSKKEKLRYVYLPEIVPMTFSTASTTFGLSIKAVISAEILAYAPKSIGVSMYVAKSNIFDGTARLFAYVIVAVSISALFETLLTLLKNKICKKYE